MRPARRRGALLRAALKTDQEIALMRRAGLVVWEAHQVARDMVRPGVTTGEIDAAVERHLTNRGAEPLFKGVPGPVPFPAATCISVNQQVVHGIPGRTQLHDGDIVSIDIGARLDGWCGDAAVTRPVGAIAPDRQRLLEVTEGALRLAIHLMGRHGRWSEVAREMGRTVRQAGFSVVEDLVGHSIGREMWEGLQVPNSWSRRFEREADFALEPGVVLAIEPMVNMGRKDVQALQDGWTIVTADDAPSAHFEHTVALTSQGPRVLTASSGGTGWAL